MLVIDGKMDFLDAQTRHQNVIIDGIPEAENEKGSDSEEKVLALFKDKLDLDPLTIGIHEVQRVGKSLKGKDELRSLPRPTLVSFLRIKDRDRVMANARKLKGSNIFIKEDYPESVRKRRKELIPKMNAARERGDIAFLRYDKLIVHKRQAKENVRI